MATIAGRWTGRLKILENGQFFGRKADRSKLGSPNYQTKEHDLVRAAKLQDNEYSRVESPGCSFARLPQQEMERAKNESCDSTHARKTESWEPARLLSSGAKKFDGNL